MREVAQPSPLIPAKAGIQFLLGFPAFAGMSGVWLNPHPRQGGGMSDHSLI